MGFAVPDEIVALANELADAARPIARRYFRSKSLVVESKVRHDPVTIADREIEEKWRSIILAKRPDDAIWGEEYGRTNPDGEWTWIFDPIDGTKAFTLGRATFGCMIGLHHRAHGFVLGLIDQPIVDLRWLGVVGQGATVNGTPLRTEPNVAMPDVRVSITNPMRLPPAMLQLHHALKSDVNFIYYGGDIMNYVGVADGSLHLNFESNQKIYDIAAAICIIREAGGLITEIDGAPIELVADHAVLASANGELHDHVLARYRNIAA